jgi:hypothetical protein
MEIHRNRTLEAKLSHMAAEQGRLAVYRLREETVEIVRIFM